MKKVTGYCFAAAVLFALLIIAPDVSAQEGNGRVTLFGGGSILKGDRSFTIGGDPKRSNFASGGKIGARGTLDLNSHWAVEVAYSYGANNLRIVDVGPPTITRPFGTRIHQLTGNALYLLREPKSSFRPFVTAGVGLMRFNPTSAARSAATVEFVDAPATITSNNKIEFNFGGGVEAPVGDHFGLRFDLRDHLAAIPRFGIPQAPAAGIADFFPISGAVNNWEVSAGVQFRFKH